MTAAMGAAVLGRGLEVSQSSDLLVLAILATQADPAGDVVMTWDELAERARISRVTLSRVLRRLEGEGYLRRVAWRFGRGRGATLFRLCEAVRGLASASCDGDHESFSVKLSKCNGSDAPARGGANEGMTKGVTGDVLSADGCRELLRGAVAEGWCGPVSELLGRAAAFEAQARLGWIARRRRGMAFDEAVTDIAGQVWLVLRECTDQVLEAESPWGLVTTILARRVASEDQSVLVEQPVDSVPEGSEVATDYSHGVATVLLEEMLSEWGGAHQTLIHRMVEYGIPQGLAWRGTRRLLEIAATTAASERITRARADVEIECMGISPAAAGAWMSLIVGTRRGGPQSSFVLRVSSGGAGVTPDEARRFETVAREVRP